MAIREHVAIKRYSHYIVSTRNKYYSGEHIIMSRHSSYSAAVHSYVSMSIGLDTNPLYVIITYEGYICSDQGIPQKNKKPLKIVYGKSISEKVAERKKRVAQKIKNTKVS